MPNANLVVLMGHLTRDPETRVTQKGMPVANFGLAINSKWTSREGEKKEETCFVDCSAFGRVAETVAEFAKKGDPLFVIGRLHQENWETQEGDRRSKITVTVDSFQLLSKKSDDAKPAPRRDNKQADGDAVPF
ncbi:MAG: single-stranded DNA-binding protein [Armatimonadetes bacterium]|nr:single-stranded DNA-binding protein [Armatimonadota bacterium]